METKRRKVIQAHIDAINEILDKLIQGKMNTTEAGEYVDKRCEELGIEKISKYTVQNLIEEILQEIRPEELDLYKKNRSKIRRNTNGKKISQEIKTKIIEEDLPRIMRSETEISKVAEKYGKSSKSIINVIENYLRPNQEEFEKYKQVVRKNMGGATIEQSRKSREKKEKISKAEIVINNEFLSLPLEEQREMVVIKYLQTKLKEKNNKGINDKSTIERKINEKVQYFLGRNIESEIDGNLTERDVLYMMYRFPNIIGFSIEDKIDKVVDYLEDEAGFGYVNTNHIISRFPTVLGYSVDRIKGQMKIIKDNNLSDAIVEHPMRLMSSKELLYALVEFAKKRYETDNLEGIKYSNIFLSNRDVKKRCHSSYEYIKKEFPLKKDKKEIGTEELNKQAQVDSKDIEKKMQVAKKLKEQIENPKREPKQK